ncbi:MAG: hypothetical protein J0L63_03850 [Anaerolineae bacterium]|nr:hypothetical protein [Anaerolineae bacterium]
MLSLRSLYRVAFVLILVLLTAVPALAQEASAPPSTTELNGTTTLVLLFGVGAVLVVGGVMYMRENAKNGKEVD